MDIGLDDSLGCPVFPVQLVNYYIREIIYLLAPVRPLVCSTVEISKFNHDFLAMGVELKFCTISVKIHFHCLRMG